MGMATFTDNQNQIKEFLHLKIFLTLQHSKKLPNCQLTIYLWECQGLSLSS
jgi:hypothetical protein